MLMSQDTARRRAARRDWTISRCVARTNSFESRLSPLQLQWLLAQAGVLAVLKRQAWPDKAPPAAAWPAVFRNSRQWCFLSLKPGAKPLQALVDCFLDAWRFEATDPERVRRRQGWFKRVDRAPRGARWRRSGLPRMRSACQASGPLLQRCSTKLDGRILMRSSGSSPTWKNDVRRAYMHAAEFWSERVKMMQV
jgi:hypothetical protein